jgi:hypothetical protein
MGGSLKRQTIRSEKKEKTQTKRKREKKSRRIKDGRIGSVQHRRRRVARFSFYIPSSPIFPYIYTRLSVCVCVCCWRLPRMRTRRVHARRSFGRRRCVCVWALDVSLPLPFVCFTDGIPFAVLYYPPALCRISTLGTCALLGQDLVLFLSRHQSN